MRAPTPFAVAALIVLPAISLANPAEDALEARHGYMKMMSINMGKLSAMAKGDMAYDEALASAAAANIVALTRYDTPGLFIPGTSSTEIDDSEALPAIWEKPDEFAQKFVAFAEAAQGAPEAVMGGQANIGPALKKMGGACKDCHDTFRKAE